MLKYIVPLLYLLITSSNVFGAGAFENDYVWQERFKETIACAKTGDVDAQYDVAEMYEKGRGTEKDPKQAFTWYEKAADQGNLKAQYKLGYMYHTGSGVSRNHSKAYKLLLKPANEGNVRAQFYLGELYANGQGVKQDLEEALTWYSRSSLGGFRPAEEEVDSIKQKLAEEEKVARRLARISANKPISKKAETSNQSQDSNRTETNQANSVALVEPEKSTVNLLLDGGWTKRNKPAEFLPSAITSCKKTSSTVVECLSEEIKRNIGVADIIYKTKAILYSINKDGNFKVAYRNNVLKITKVKQDGLGNDNLPVKLGWQDTEHRLECKIENGVRVDCIKNKIRKETYSKNANGIS